jgi:hypothetical protein
MANGLITSNITGEDITPTFDYGSLTNRDKEVAREIIHIMLRKENMPLPTIIAEINQSFQLEEIPMAKIEDTLWHQLTKDEQLGPSIQGFRESVDANGNKIRIPHIGFSADLDYLDDFLNRIVQKVNALK